jgi:hypothetical protein
VSVATADYSRLLHRLQFILGPCFMDTFSSWQRLKIRRQLFLTVHPDLNVSCVWHKERTILLLGFILDPENPRASNNDVLNTLITNFASSTDLFMQTSRFGGRWILIVDDGSTVVLFHDAAGLRQVFYTDIEYTQQLWCASQPGTLADILGLQVDANAQDFINSPQIRSNSEYWWPGDSSLYKEVKHLLPNHYLDLETGYCHRYWPDRNLSPLPLDTVVETSSSLLRGLLTSAAERFNLVLSLTAGWDSRLVLAACYDIKDTLSYMTLKKINDSDNNMDVVIASSLLRRLQLQHDIVESQPKKNDAFFTFFRCNVTLAHEVWATDALAIFNFYRQNKVAITGNVSEVARCYYKLPNYLKQKLNGEHLASIVGMESHPFAIEHFEKWSKDVGEIHNLDILDLFYWEQRVGNWLAMCQLEFDTAWKDIFTPYNCRLLLTNMLSAEDVYRRPPQYELHRKMILNLWAEVLEEPINPHKVKTLRQRLQKQIRYFLSVTKHALTR